MHRGNRLGACSQQPATNSEVNPATSTFGELLAADLPNPELSAALGQRISVLRDREASISNEMRTAGFTVKKGPEDCEILAYEGPKRSRFGIDRTVRITWKDCAGEKESESEMVVNFGDAE